MSAGYSSTSLVDSCAFAIGVAGANRLRACNNRAVSGATYLTFTFTAGQGGYPAVVLTTANSNTGKVITPIAPTSYAGPGSTASVTVQWGSICSNLGTDISSDCIMSTSQTATGTLQVGTSTTGGNDNTLDDATSVQVTVSSQIGQGTGISSTVADCATTSGKGLCHFNIGNGDGKVALRDPSGLGFPGSPLVFKYVRVLWAAGENTFASITAASSHQDLDIKAGTSLDIEPTRVEGFTNDQFYSFKTAVVDAAGNVGYYTDDSADGNASCAQPHRPSGNECHIGRPGEVVGVLSDDTRCFVATAAYGSEMASEVSTFRKFRNQFLLSNRLGKRLVAFYYEHSPKYARIIRESEMLRAVVRGFLWPLLGFARMALNVGILASTSIALGGLGLVAALCSLGPALLRARARRRTNG